MKEKKKRIRRVFTRVDIRVSTIFKDRGKSRRNKNESSFQTSFNSSYFPREIMQ